MVSQILTESYLWFLSFSTFSYGISLTFFPFLTENGRQHATEVRRALSAASESSRPASCSSSSLGGGSSLCGGSVLSDITTLYDYEDTMNEQEFVVEGVGGPADPLRGRLSFPTDDLQIYLLPRPCRTQTPVVPPEPMCVVLFLP